MHHLIAYGAMGKVNFRDVFRVKDFKVLIDTNMCAFEKIMETVPLNSGITISRVAMYRVRDHAVADNVNHIQVAMI